MGHIKVKDLLDIYKCGGDPFCVKASITAQSMLFQIHDSFCRDSEEAS